MVMNKAQKAKILDELGGIDEADYDALVVEFIAEAEKRIPELEIAMKEEDFDSILKIAHSIKGAAGNLRIYKIQEIAGLLESEAKNNKNKTVIATALQEIVRELDELRTG